jgi:isopentenyl phosphate kinase
VSKLTFLKLGGSLITDKTRPYTLRPDVLEAAAAQIAGVLDAAPQSRLLLGHGSGSFGHAAASRYATRQGVAGAEGWRGFAEVWFQASTLNRMVMDALHRAGLPAVALAPVAAVTARDGQVAAWDLAPLQSALSNGLLPVVYGDVLFDTVRGGTILSTEDLFAHLACQLHPERILLAGQEAGVWADYPRREHLREELTPEGFSSHASGLKAAAGADVTGGMQSKVSQMLALVERVPGLEVLIFSGEQPGNIRKALLGEHPGTLIHR